MNELHEILFNILDEFDDFCRKNNLTYYLAYGTLLGAVRHQGFIPWDDDVDVWMPRGDYIKLYEYLLQNIGIRYGLSEFEVEYIGLPGLKMVLKYSDTSVKIMRNRGAENTITNPWIDIFALDSFPQKKRKQYLCKIKFYRFLYLIFQSKGSMEKIKNSKGVKKWFYIIKNRFEFSYKSIEKASEWYYQALTKYNRKLDDARNLRYFSYAGVYYKTIEKCVFYPEWFGEPKEIEFEGKKFFVPCNYDSVLKTIYGDYMVLPPKRDRTNKHSVELIEC